MAKGPGRPRNNPASNVNKSDNDLSDNNNESSSDYDGPASYDKTHLPPVSVFGSVKPAVKYFSVPVPLPDTQVADAIRESVLGISGKRKLSKTAKPFERLQKVTKELETKKQKCEHQRQKVEVAREAKEKGLNELKETKEKEVRASLESLEQTIISEHEAQVAEKQEQLKEEIKTQFDAEFEKQLEVKQKERDAQERKLDEEEKAAAEGTNDETKADGDEDEGIKPAKRSELKEKEIEIIQGQIDKLTETKSEMVWLLKQVIKAETQRKIKEAMKAKAAAAAAK